MNAIVAYGHKARISPAYGADKGRSSLRPVGEGQRGDE